MVSLNSFQDIKIIFYARIWDEIYNLVNFTYAPFKNLATTFWLVYIYTLET